MRLVTVPATLKDEAVSLGIIPNSSMKVSENDFMDMLKARKKMNVSQRFGNWADSVSARLNIEDSKYVDYIDVLAFPYGGDTSGRDCIGEFFHPFTDFKEEYLPCPPVINAHGYDVDGTGESERTVVGEVVRRWKDERGGWVKVGVLRTFYADQIISAAIAGTLKASSHAVLKQLNPIVQGQIDVWLAGEISMITPESGIEPCNFLAQGVRGAYSKSKEDALRLINDQPEEYRPKLLDLLDIAEDVGDDIEVATNNNPVNPDNPNISEDSEEIDLNDNEDTMSDKKDDKVNAAFTPEQRTELADMLAAAIQAASVSKPAVEEADDVDTARQKSAPTSLLARKAAEARTSGKAMSEAKDLATAWVEAGVIPAENAQDAITVLSAIQLHDGRSKSGDKTTESFVSLIESLSLNGGFKKAFGFGKHKADNGNGKDESESMLASIGIGK